MGLDRNGTLPVEFDRLIVSQPSLKELTLERVEISNAETVAAIRRIPLEHLCIRYSAVPDNSWDFRAIPFQSLTSLDVSGSEFSGADLGRLSIEAPQLTRFAANACPNLTAEGLGQLVTNLALREMELNHCSAEVMVDGLCEKISASEKIRPSLRSFSATGSNFEFGLRILLQACPNLEVVDLRSSHRLTLFDPGSVGLPSQAVKVKQYNLLSINLSDCRSLTTAQMISFLNRCRYLEVLILDACTWMNRDLMTSHVMTSVHAFCPSLRVLSLRGITKIWLPEIDATPEEFFEHMTELCLIECSLRGSGIIRLLKALPKLRALEVGGKAKEKKKKSEPETMMTPNPKQLHPVFCPRLQRLSLFSSPLTLSELDIVLACSPNLRTLRISKIPTLTLDPDFFALLVRSCPILNTLSLEGPTDLTHLFALATLDRLWALRLRALPDFSSLTTEVTDAGQPFPSLLAFDVSNSACSGEELNRLFPFFPNLQQVRLPESFTHQPLPQALPSTYFFIAHYHRNRKDQD